MKFFFFFFGWQTWSLNETIENVFSDGYNVTTLQYYTDMVLYQIISAILRQTKIPLTVHIESPAQKTPPKTIVYKVLLFTSINNDKFNLLRIEEKSCVYKLSGLMPEQHQCGAYKVFTAHIVYCFGWNTPGGVDFNWLLVWQYPQRLFDESMKKLKSNIFSFFVPLVPYNWSTHSIQSWLSYYAICVISRVSYLILSWLTSTLIFYRDRFWFYQR